MKKESIFLGIIILLVGLVIFQICSSPTQEPNTDVWKEALAKKELQIATLESEASQHKEKRRQDSIVYLTAIKGEQNKTRRAEVTVMRLKANPKIIKVREEVKEVDSLIVAMDSVSASLNSQLFLANKFIQTLQIDLGKTQVNFNERIDLEKGKYQDQQQILLQTEVALKKKQRGNKLLRAIAVIGSVGAFILGSQ